MKKTMGRIFNIQHFSVHDGQGIRSTIFLAGCPLRCRWCANPESWNFDNSYVREVSLEEVVEEIKRNIIFYRHSGGGITYSGGEPTYQKDFLKAMVDYFYKLGLDQAIETSGYFNFEELKETIEKLDFIFTDLKHMDPVKHKELTGKSNGLILDNLKKIGKLNIPIVIRIPLIEDINDHEDNLIKTAEFIKSHVPRAQIELLAYHQLGNYKYDKLGLSQYKYVFKTPSEKRMMESKRLLENLGVETVEFK